MKIYNMSHWGGSPHLLVNVVLNEEIDEERLNKELLSHEHWQNNKDLKDFLKGEDLNVANIRRRVQEEGSYESWITNIGTENGSLQKISCSQVLQ